MGVEKGKMVVGVDRNRPTNTLDELSGKVAGIDASIWLMDIITSHYPLQVKFHMKHCYTL